MDRRQPADGLPRGWSFIFDDGDKDNAEIHPDVRGLKIISSSNMKYSSVEAAINRHTKQLENVMERKQIFYRQIGAHLLEEDKMHPLLRKGYCREWINLDGTKQTMYGRITKVVMDKADDKKKLTVTYVKKNVDLVNSVPNASGCIYAPMSDTVCEKMAWGGCLLYQKKMGGRKVNWLPLDLAPFHTTWIVPEMYRCELVHNRDQNSVVSLPRVTIYHAGFELTFNVRTSTIPNAGYGVFLSCRHIMPDSEEGSTNFELNPGELLDFGVYAPYRLEDKRNDHEFLLKSFIHGFKCESYSFETNDPNHEYVFDITDDITGDPHSMALRHVPPYVNEYSSDVVPVVNARHDVEGALHYLLGHSEERDGSFRFPADGREQEIFVDYGPNYESVRLREGFERIHMEAAEKKKRLKIDELEYLDEIETYTANEVQNTVKLFDKVLASGAEGLNQSVVERMVVVTILLRQRADVIMKELAGLNDDDSFCDNGATDIDQHELKKACGELLFRLCRLWGNDTDMKLRMLGFDIYLKACTDAFKGLQLEDFTPAEFRNLIIDGPPVCGIASG